MPVKKAIKTKNSACGNKGCAINVLPTFKIKKAA